MAFLRAATLALGLVVLAAPLAQAQAPAHASAIVESSLTYGASGPVKVYKASAEPDRFVVFISGDGGWNEGVVDMARQLAGMDATVVGVDIRHYLRAAQAGSGSTIYPAGDFSGLAQAVQKSLGFHRYHRPVLVGYSSGATLAYGTIAQSPSAIFQGAIGLGFCPDLKTDKPLAAGDGKLAHKPDPKLGFIYEPSRTLTAPFVAMQGGADETCPPAATHAFMAQVSRGRVVDLPKVGHGYSVPANWTPQFAQAFESLYPRVAAAPAPVAAGASDARLAALPLVAVRGAGAGDTLAVMYSGDGGWAGIDQGMAGGLANAGIPVVGYDSLRYFWSKRSPEEAAADLAAVLRHYMAAWGKSKIILAGYSFGADALPAIAPHLPADLKSKVELVALIGVDTDGELEFQAGDWFNSSSSNAYKIAPALAAMKGLKLVCIYGDQEKDAACPTFSPAVISQVKLSGGHHYDGDYAAVAQAVLRAAK